MNTDKTVSAFPDGDNLFNWKGTIQGAAGTVSKQAGNIFTPYQGTARFMRD